MDKTKILIALLVAMTIVLAPISSLTYSQAEEPLTLQLSFDQSHYSSDQKFNAIITVNNTSDKKVTGATVKFYLGKRLNADEDRSFPDERPQKPSFVYTRSRSFQPGETQLRVTKKISGTRLTEGTYPAWAVIIKRNKIIASKRSALVIINPRIVPPLAVTLLWNIHDQVHFDGDGVFTDRQIQRECSTNSTHAGILSTYLSSLNTHPNFKVNMNFTPLLAEQILAMTKGYKVKEDNKTVKFSKDSNEVQDAQQILNGFRRLAKQGQIEMVPAPFSYPSLNFLAAQGWDEDAVSQIRKGKERTKEIFGLATDPGGTYTPELILTADTLGYLVESDTKYTVLDEEFLENIDPHIKDIYKPYRLEDEQNNRATVFFTDPIASSILSDTTDPEAVVQQLLGLLAEVYLRQPEKQKVVVIAPSNKDFRPSAELLEALYTRLEQTPWLKSTTFSVAEQLISPDTKPLKLPSEHQAELIFNQAYSVQLEAKRRTINQFKAMTVNDHPLEKKLWDNLLIAEASHFLESEDSEKENLGFSFLDKIETEIKAELNKIEVADNQTITLTSSKGKIPIAINNKTGYPLEVTVTVESKDLIFPDGNSKKIRLHPRENLYTLPVVTKNSTPRKIKLTLHYQDYIIKEGSLTVKSLYYNFTIIIISGLLVLSVALPLAWRYLKTQK